MIRKFLSVALVVAFIPLSAFALDLDEARSKGLVGERPDGYVAAVSDSPSAEVADLVKSINQKRKAKYKEIAEKNGQEVKVVESLTATKVLEKLDKGSYYLDKSGSWVKK